MEKVISDLINLADSLDKKGQHKLADDIDAIIKKYSKDNISNNPLEKFRNMGPVEIELPEEEYNSLREVARDLKNSLSEEGEE